MNTVMENPNENDVKRILRECGLPFSDITPGHLKHFFASGDSARLSGIVGLELYQDTALLRSLAVLPGYRNTGLGRRLVAHAERYALAQGVRAIYLLTTTADAFFSRIGYSPVSRDRAPSAIRNTAEFSNLCPSSSVFMVKRLVG